VRKIDPEISFRADVELPTGSSSKGFGNGSFDFGFTLLMDKKLGETFKTYWSAGVVFPGDLKGKETIHLKNYVHAGAGVEAALWRSFSLLGQISFHTSPFPRTDIGTVDRTAALLSLGGRYSAGKNSFEFSLTEDPNTAGAPDFTVNLFYKRKL